MRTIRDLLSRDLTRRIEEVIKLEQRDEQTVHRELTEYVTTYRIREQYRDVLQAISDGPGDPTEAIGVWVSGFFGSGKSSFAKNLGYILGNQPLKGVPAGKLFLQQLEEQAPDDDVTRQVRDLLGYVNARIPTNVIMFDVQVDRAVRSSTETIAEIMYTVLLRELDYAEDYDLASLEIQLEAEGRLGQFVRLVAEMYRDQVKIDDDKSTPLPLTLTDVHAQDYAVWRMVRKGSDKAQRTSAALHRLDPMTHPTADAWLRSYDRKADVSIATLVDRTFVLAARRCPNQAMVFVIDEVGQYVARSGDKIENLRAVVEHYGQESKNRVLARRAVAPVWIVVTSQEKLEEVVAAIDDKRVQLARLQDRFRYRVDMAPADIREVATRRVLSKRPEADPVLRNLYQEYGSQLKAHTAAERSQISFTCSEDDFVQFYPYLPHFVELSIDIVSGMRLQAGAPRHIGGSNRTIIKQAYEMLVGERTDLAAKPVGTLVSLDRIYDLIGENLSSQRKDDIRGIEVMWQTDKWPLKVAKAIALLEFVRGVPRTEKNLAAVLFPSMDSPSCLPDVERAIGLLHERQFVRQTEDGWKLLTDQEKSWTTERTNISPTPRERKEILEDLLRALFGESGLSRYVRARRTFKLGITWEGRTIAQGEIPLDLRLSDDQSVHDADLSDALGESREKPRQTYWIACLTDELHDCVAELARSRQMIAKYDQLRAQGKLQGDEGSTLASEKLELGRLEARTGARLRGILQQGTGYFKGVRKNGPDLGKSFDEILKAFMDYAVPSLYDKLGIGNVPVKGSEAEDVLKAVDLKALPLVFYPGPEGLGLVATEGRKTVLNPQAPIAREVLEFLQQEHAYGNKVTGRVLEDHFGGLGYGWPREVVWLTLAALLRAGVVEVTYQGRRFRNHLDAQVRAAFASTNAFRSASFAPRKAPDLRTLVSAAKRYEELTGDEVDVDESAIALAFQKLAAAEMDALLPVQAVAGANAIPVLDLLEEYRTTLLAIQQGASDDVVNTLAGEGESFKKLRQQVQEVRAATDDAGLRRLRRARQAVTHMAPLLSERGVDADIADAATSLASQLKNGTYYHTPTRVDEAIAKIEDAYQKAYKTVHEARTEAFGRALDRLKGLPEWLALDPAQQHGLSAPLSSRACAELKLASEQLACATCSASIPQMESDLAAVGGLANQALQRVQELLRPEDKIERVRVASAVPRSQPLGTEAEVDEVLKDLRARLLELIASGVKIILE